jgi:hypothetical protein
MAKKESPDGVRMEEVDPTYKAGRTSIYPHDALGAYRYSGFTGLLPAALAANAEIFQFRWTDNVNLCLLKYLKVRYAVITGFTAAQELAFDVQPSTAWSASGTGGAQIAPNAANLMRRTNYPQSKVGDMRIATTAALGLGTKTLTGQSILTGMGKTLAAAATVQDASFESVMDLTSTFDDPMIFQQNEGFSVRNSILLGAAGTVRASIQVGWAEYLGTDYPSL